MYIFTWSKVSDGASELKDAMGITKIKHENSKFKGKPSKTVINWGSSQLPEEIMKCRVLNKPDIVAACTNKLEFFRRMNRNLSRFLPPWTENFADAVDMVSKGHTVMARTMLRSSQGNGIVIMTKDKPESLVHAQLYTQYIPKKEEYRIHVVRGKVIDFQRKVLSQAAADKANETGTKVDFHIRNLENGFIYKREGVDPPPEALTAACAVITETGLDFGAVDIVCHSKTKAPYVLEVNTAPGLTGTTVQSYAKALAEI